MVRGLVGVLHLQFLSGKQEQGVPDLMLSVTCIFLLFLFSHFSNLLSPSFAGSWANPEVSGFSLNLHFTLNGLSFHTT